MAKAKREKPIGKRAEKYNERLEVNGSFMDIMKAAVKNADNHSAKKKP